MDRGGALPPPFPLPARLLTPAILVAATPLQVADGPRALPMLRALPVLRTLPASSGFACSVARSSEPSFPSFRDLPYEPWQSPTASAGRVAGFRCGGVVAQPRAAFDEVGVPALGGAAIVAESAPVAPAQLRPPPYGHEGGGVPPGAGQVRGAPAAVDGVPVAGL